MKEDQIQMCFEIHIYFIRSASENQLLQNVQHYLVAMNAEH